MGKWAIRFLLLSLAITPLHQLAGWRFGIKLRKPAGLLAFMFVSIHVAIYLFGKGYYSTGMSLLRRLTEPQFIIFGLAAFIILSLMALTSLRVTTKLMGHYWKPLHRLVYAAGILIMVHSLIAATTTKSAFFNGPASAIELSIYTVILTLLLLARIPAVKNWLKRVLPGGPPARRRRRGPLAT
jgi:sulfoxide reductase heme-binding subunit YedZ